MRGIAALRGARGGERSPIGGAGRRAAGAGAPCGGAAWRGGMVLGGSLRRIAENALLRARLFPPPRWHAQGCTAHVSGAHVRSIGAGRHWRRDTARVGRGAGQLVSDRAGFGWLQFCGLVFVAGAAAAGGALHGGALDRAWPATAM